MKLLMTKMFALLVLFLLLQIPLNWTQHTIQERSNYRQQAISSIAKNQADAQRVIGPILKMPYTRTYWHEHKDNNNNIIRERQTDKLFITLLPDQLDINGDMQVDERKKGIFPIPVFRTNLTLKGSFNVIDLSTLKINNDDEITLGKPIVIVSLSDQHGIKNVEALQWGNTTNSFSPGAKIDLQNNEGLSAVLNSAPTPGNVSFQVNLSVIGTQSFSIVPIGIQNTFNMQSNWPHPQFKGSQLPDKRSINNHGFTATWQTTELATNIHSFWEKCQNNSLQCDSLINEEIGVSLFESVDIYQQAERAVKYGFLFLSITFIAFLLYEVLCQLAIHPVQYGLVGLALAIFFLLLLSFSEHVGFAPAYLIASSSCITLLGFYIHAIFKRWVRSGLFIGILAALYGVIYIILQLEDAALLAGSIMLFT